jgi:hypothetical protein
VTKLVVLGALPCNVLSKISNVVAGHYGQPRLVPHSQCLSQPEVKEFKPVLYYDGGLYTHYMHVTLGSRSTSSTPRPSACCGPALGVTKSNKNSFTYFYY